MKKSFVLLLALLVAAPACFAAAPAPDPNPDPGLVDVLIDKIFVTDEMNVKGLLAAAKEGHIGKVQELLDKGVNINSYMKPKNKKSAVHYTALCAAASTNKILMMKYLLNRGASANVVCLLDDGRPIRPKEILMRQNRYAETLPALDKNELYVWKMLLRKDKSPFVYSGGHGGHIYHLIYHGDMELIKLLRDGGHFKLVGTRGKGNVASAFASGNVGKVNRVIEGGGLLSLLDEDDYDSILAYSALANHIDMAAWLLKNRQFSQKALDWAINQLARSEEGWRFSYQESWPTGKTLSKEMIALLRSHGAHFSEYNAALLKGEPLSKLQLAADVKEIAAALSERTLLELYKKKRKSEVALLMKNGVQKDLAEKLLLAAIENRDIGFLKQILPYKQTPKYHYFLEMAIAMKDLKLFNVLLQNYNEEKVDFTRLLGTAVFNGSLELTKLCVEKGGDVNGYLSDYVYTGDSYGGIQRGHIQTYKMLVVADYGAESYDIASFLSSKGATK